MTTSYSNAAGTTVVNQVKDVYNGFGQVIAEYPPPTAARASGVGTAYDAGGIHGSITRQPRDMKTTLTHGARMHKTGWEEEQR